jgi:hypothetical protein
MRGPLISGNLMLFLVCPLEMSQFIIHLVFPFGGVLFQSLNSFGSVTIGVLCVAKLTIVLGYAYGFIASGLSGSCGTLLWLWAYEPMTFSAVPSLFALQCMC